MLVAHIVESLDESYGGPAFSIPQLAYHASSPRIDHILLSTKRRKTISTNPLINQLRIPWFEFNSIGSQKVRMSFSLVGYLIRLAHSHRNLGLAFHVHNLWNFVPLAAFLVAFVFKVPLIVSPRGSLFEWSLSQGRIRKKISWSLFQRSMLKNAVIIHVTSEQESAALLRLGFSAERIYLSPNGAIDSLTSNLTCPRDISCKLLGVDPQKKYALFLSRIHKSKGIEKLLRSWRQASSGTDYVLLIAGQSADPKYMEYIVDLADESCAAETVLFIGMVSGKKKMAAFSLSSFFVLPSFTENFGIAIAEALSFGLPVITTTGTPWQVVADVNAGAIIDLEKDELADELCKFVRLPEAKLLEMGIRAREIAEKFNWVEIGKDFHITYDRILSCVRE